MRDKTSMRTPPILLPTNCSAREAILTTISGLDRAGCRPQVITIAREFLPLILYLLKAPGSVGNVSFLSCFQLPELFRIIRDNAAHPSLRPFFHFGHFVDRPNIDIAPGPARSLEKLARGELLLHV